MTGNPKIWRPDSPDQKALLKKMTGEITRSGTKTVSFRLEDTLVLLPFDNMADIFTLMESDFDMLSAVNKPFTYFRNAAQAKAGRSGKVTLEKIYDIIAASAKLTDSGREQLMKRECELVVYFSFPRKAGKALFDEVVRAKKKTAVMTSTIYPRSVVNNIISRCGYDRFNELVIANEHDNDFDMLDDIMERTSSSPAQLLHIGGDVEKDVEAAVLKGARSMLLTPVRNLMIHSGKLRGYIEAKHAIDLEQPEYMMLRCAFGIYAAYGFDIPQNKVPHSDFCGDLYMTGFIVLGPLSLMGDYTTDTPIRESVLAALNASGECQKGAEDFRALMNAHFADFLDKYGSEDCDLPFRFFTDHSAAGDRMLFDRVMQPTDLAEWAGFVTDADIAPIHTRRIQKNAMQRFADRLFPPGTKVRNIVDGILLKLHR